LPNLTNNSDQLSFNLEQCETLLAANITLAKLITQGLEIF